MVHNRVQRLTITAIFIAIIILQIFVPFLGYFRIIPGLPAITALPLTVAVGASLLGPRFGFSIGLFWGLLSMILAYTQPTSMVSLVLFQNPLIAILPRAVAGAAAGFIGQLGKGKSKKKQTYFYTVAGISSAITNTVLVILLSSLIFMAHPNTLLNALGQAHTSASLVWILIVALGTNGVIEAIFSGILTPIIMMPLNKVMKFRKY